MAAALIMLMLIPLGAGDDYGMHDKGIDDMGRRQKRMEDMEQEYLKNGNENFNSILNEGARKLDQKINSWFDF